MVKTCGNIEETDNQIISVDCAYMARQVAPSGCMRASAARQEGHLHSGGQTDASQVG